MPRLLGVDIPGERPTVISLTYLYGVGPKIARDLCHKAGVDPQGRARDLREDELARFVFPSVRTRARGFTDVTREVRAICGAPTVQVLTRKRSGRLDPSPARLLTISAPGSKSKATPPFHCSCTSKPDNLSHSPRSEQRSLSAPKRLLRTSSLRAFRWYVCSGAACRLFMN